MSFQQRQARRIRISRYKLAIWEALPTGDVLIDELLAALNQVSLDLINLLSDKFDEEEADYDANT